MKAPGPVLRIGIMHLNAPVVIRVCSEHTCVYATFPLTSINSQITQDLCIVDGNVDKAYCFGTNVVTDTAVCTCNQ